MSRALSNDLDRLFWIDYETTGINLNSPKVLPIEVGVVVTDIHLKQLNDYTSLILYPVFSEVGSWKAFSEEADGAFKVHQIPLEECRSKGRDPGLVAEEMVDLASEHCPEGGRMIMISDNIQFEWKLTEKLLKIGGVGEWPWHYGGWDTSVLELVPGLGFEDPRHPEHRGLSDVLELLDACRKAGVGR